MKAQKKNTPKPAHQASPDEKDFLRSLYNEWLRGKWLMEAEVVEGGFYNLIFRHCLYASGEAYFLAVDGILCKHHAQAESDEEKNALLADYLRHYPEFAGKSEWYQRERDLLQLKATAQLAAAPSVPPVPPVPPATTVGATPPDTPLAGRPRSKKIVDRDNLIASLRQSKKSFQRIGRNKQIARSLDEQGERPPDGWGVRTFLEATENPKTSRAFDRMVAKAQFKKVSTP